MRKAEKSVHEKPAALLHLTEEMKMKSTVVIYLLQGFQKVFQRSDGATLRKVMESQTFVKILLAATVIVYSSSGIVHVASDSLSLGSLVPILSP